MLLRKKQIQRAFKDILGLKVDQPRAGSGSTNDGNTARRFFRKSADVAAITGLDELLIRRFRILLKALSSKSKIDVALFENFASETKSALISLYP